MNQNYSDLIEQISHLICETTVEQKHNLEEKVHQLDGDLFSLLRAIDLKVMSKLLDVTSFDDLQNWLDNL